MFTTFRKAVAGIGAERMLLATMLPMAAACSTDTEAGSQAAFCRGVLGTSIDTTAAAADVTVGDEMAVVSSSDPPCTSVLSKRASISPRCAKPQSRSIAVRYANSRIA